MSDAFKSVREQLSYEALRRKAMQQLKRNRAPIDNKKEDKAIETLLKEKNHE